MKNRSQIVNTAMFFLKAVENLGLLIISIATTVALYQEVALMVYNQSVTLADLLLIFLLLEVFAMVGLYYESGKLPVRFPLYIAMVSMARYIILDIKDIEVWKMISVSVSILLLAFAVLLIRYGHTRFPYISNKDEKRIDS